MTIKKSKPSFFEVNKLMIGGHRGAAGVAPENTLVSFQRAFGDGADFVEIDLRESLEGELVIFHDEDLERTTNGKGEVRCWALKDLKTLDAGYHFTLDGGVTYPYRGQKIEISTMEEFFATFPGVKATVDIKQAGPSFIHKLVTTIKHSGREDLVLLGAEQDTVMQDIRRQIHEQAAKIATGFSYGEVYAFMHWIWKGQPGNFDPQGHALQIPCVYRDLKLITEQTLKVARELGVEMHAWTVNDIEEMGRLIRMGVGGILTDYPARLRDLQGQMQQVERRGTFRVLQV